MTDKIFKEESGKLSQVVSQMKSARDALSKSMKSLGAFNLDKLKEIRESPSTNATDFQQFLTMLDTKNAAFNISDKYKKLEELEYLSKEPYFSRIDIKRGDTEKASTHYIGKFGYSEHENPIVIDWRAKVASVYYKYRFPQKNVEYTTPKGKVTADLLLKRTFEIDSGELVKYYNNDIKLDENEIIVDKIGDRTGGVLEDIIETIQESQHSIIEADPRRVCIVQGTVGSGKSTVAIHKLSHIFFNYPGLIKPERSILIAKSQILVGYLSTLFPKLGIFNINYGTIRDILYKILFAEKISSDFDLSQNTNVSEFNLEKVLELEKRLAKVHSYYDKEIEALFNTPETESYGGFVYDSSMPVRQNLTEAIQDLEEERKFQEEFIKTSPTNPRSKLFKDNVKIMKSIIRKLSKLRNMIRSEHLSNLVKEYKLKKSRTFGYLEALIYISLYSELIGFSKFEPYEYCVVDEGQDLGILEYFVLNKLVLNGRFCILGDLNQSYAEEGLDEWEEIFEVVNGAKDAQKFVLDTNYRSTKPIIDYANAILAPYTEQYLPIPIDRVGPIPKEASYSTNNDVLREFKTELEIDINNLNKSIGIICLTDELYDQADEIVGKLQIPEDKLIRLREKDRIVYLPRAVYLTHFDNCKGLEFGKVYVLGLHPGEVSSFMDAKKAFVAVTRAMNELSIYYEQS